MLTMLHRGSGHRKKDRSGAVHPVGLGKQGGKPGEHAVLEDAVTKCGEDNDRKPCCDGALLSAGFVRPGGGGEEVDSPVARPGRRREPACQRQAASRTRPAARKKASFQLEREIQRGTRK